MALNFNTLIEILLFLIASYLMFYVSFLKSFGKETAKLVTQGDLTNIKESVKQDFREKIEEYKSKLSEELSFKIEPLKAELHRGNISYQINLTEITKRRLDRIEEYYMNLIDLQAYTAKNMFHYLDDSDFNRKTDEFKIKYDSVNLSRHKCSLYLNDILNNKIIDSLNNVYEAYLNFRKYYDSNSKQIQEGSFFNLEKQQLLTNLSSRKIDSLDKLDNEIDKFPLILNELAHEFKTQIILKNID